MSSRRLDSLAILVSCNGAVLDLGFVMMEFDVVILGERIMAPHDFMGMAARMAVGKYLPDAIRLHPLFLVHDHSKIRSRRQFSHV